MTFEAWWKQAITGTGEDPCCEAICKQAYQAGHAAGAEAQHTQDLEKCEVYCPDDNGCHGHIANAIRTSPLATPESGT